MASAGVSSVIASVASAGVLGSANAWMKRTKCSGKCKRIQLSVMCKCIAMTSATVCIRVANANALGLFCRI